MALPIFPQLPHHHQRHLRKIVSVACNKRIPETAPPRSTPPSSHLPPPNSAPSLEIRQSVTQKPTPDSTAEFPAVDDTPLAHLISEIVSDFAARISNFPLGGTADFSAAPSPSSATSSENRQCCLQQEDPGDRPTSIDAPIQPPPSPNSAPSLEIRQSVTQKPKLDSTAEFPAVDDTPLAHLISEILSDFAARISNFPAQGGTDDFSAAPSTSSATSSENRQCCLQQEDLSDQTTSTREPEDPTPFPNSTPALEIRQSVTQKPRNPMHEPGDQSVSSNTPNTTTDSPAANDTPLRHSDFGFVSDFVFRISDFSLPPPRKPQPKIPSL